MARCGCGGGACNCTVTAGSGVTVDGTGSTANPYVVSSQVTCDQVRPCISAGPGATYNPATGVIGARLSSQAGNNLVLGGDQGLYVPAGAATVQTACGLDGDGSAGAPLTVPVGTWPYACSADTEGGRLYCDSSGTLRTLPPPKTAFFEDSQNITYPATAVPAATNTLIETRSLTITNPDACRTAYVIVEVELDVDFTLPPGSGAASQIGGDTVNYFANAGSATVNNVHATETFVYQRTIAPGGTLVEPLNVRMGRGSGGATYNRIQSFMRAFVFAL